MKEVIQNTPKRLITQLAFFLLQNPFLRNIPGGTIYQGRLKHICTPGLNCYACPAAAVSCPVGAAQSFLAGARHRIGLFITGFILCAAIMFGRFICGYVCPMGFLQDLIYRIKTPKLRLRLRFARYIKYAVLAIFVILLPLLIRNEISGLGSPWFCKYICPSGTIFGALPLLAANDFLRAMTGVQFYIKISMAAGIITGSLFVYRIFCRVLCPLGALYALFNRYAVLRMRCDRDKCVSCGECARQCHIRIEPHREANSPECVRCGSCVKACKAKALTTSRMQIKRKERLKV